MPFVSAKCPNCGASIQVDNQRESGFCQYCGSKIQIKEAIVKVRIDKSANFANYRELAQSAYRGNDGSNSLKYVEKALEINPRDAEMWFLKAKATMKTSYKIVNDALVLECCHKAVEYASDKPKMLSETYLFLFDSAKKALTMLADEEVWNSFWKDIYDGAEQAAVNFIKEIPEDFTDADGERLREKFAAFYIEYLRSFIRDLETWRWVNSRKERFLDFAPKSLAEREEVWKNFIADFFNPPSNHDNTQKLEDLSPKAKLGCIILVLALNIFLWYHILAKSYAILQRFFS